MEHHARPCTLVVVETQSGGLTFSSASVKQVVKRGSSVFGGVVVLCRPDPCFVTRDTAVRAVRRVEYSVERLVHNVIVTVRYGSDIERFVFPVKVWELVEGTVKRFFTSRPPQQGFVFYGPPGTGKTSLARLVAQLHGLPVFEVRPQEVLSKWVGESERNLYVVLREAESSEPSVVLVDDCEWLFRSRELHGPGSTHVELTLSKILLEYIGDLYVSGRKVMVVGTTNAPLEMIDRALVRSGRLGKPIHVPLPDFEAVYEFLTREGVDPETAKRWAYYAVNVGLGMADVKLDLLQQLRDGREPKVEPRVERGYARYVFLIPREYERSVEAYFRILDPLGDFAEVVRERSRNYRRTVVWFAGPEKVALAVANAFITYHAKMPAITLISSRYVLDAVDSANTLDGFLIVPWSVVRYSHMDPTLLETATKVAYAGEGAPEAIKIDVIRGAETGTTSRYDVERGLTAIVLSFYGARISEKTFDKLLAMARTRGLEQYLELLEKLGYYGVKPEHLEYYGF